LERWAESYRCSPLVAETALLGWEKFQPASRARTVKVYVV
jgi:hypothetical protein